MKNYKLLIYLFVSFCFLSCKKQYDRELSGPEVKTNITLTKPFTISTPVVDFAGEDSNLLYFDAKLSSPVKWKITITGTQSMAQRTITGYSDTIPKSAFWNGAQDSLYYFGANEICNIVLSVDNRFRRTGVSDNLENRGDIDAADQVLASTQVFVKSRKKSPANQLSIFKVYEYTSDKFKTIIPDETAYSTLVNENYVGYDQEAVGRFQDSDVPILSNQWPQLIFEDPNLVPFSKTKGGLINRQFFMLRGTDRTTNLFPEKKDYYVGRAASLVFFDATLIEYFYDGINIPQTLANYPPDSIFFNVFVYGNGDGSKINYSVKEDEDGNGFDENMDEAYQATIVVNFVGWKLFSIPYSDFVYTQFKAGLNNPKVKADPTKLGELSDGKFHDKVKEPENIVQIQFGLVAPTEGGKARAIFDNPTISWGKPFQY